MSLQRYLDQFAGEIILRTSIQREFFGRSAVDAYTDSWAMKYYHRKHWQLTDLDDRNIDRIEELRPNSFLVTYEDGEEILVRQQWNFKIVLEERQSPWTYSTWKPLFG